MSAYEPMLHATERAQDKTSGQQILRWLALPFFVISKFWTCWHRRMSRPFTRDGETYRVCLRCGVHRRFDLEQWKTKGSYYRAKQEMEPVSSETVAVPKRAKLRLIA
ncbi:MAG TPA: hypothetical protein VHQ94_02805 [Pyrinomonadaceae bacterium]|jgi:hypothetical protein|nr:hypothetical protein [Pyrinomonadaceae bacterium]